MEKMDKKTQFSMWYVFIAVWGVLLLQNAWRQAAQVEQIPYSEFRAYLDEGLVEEAQIGQNAIRGVLKDQSADGPKKFVTVRVEQDLADQLQANNVRFAGVIENTFFRDLLSWIVPVLLFLGLWFLVIRRVLLEEAAAFLIRKETMSGDELKEIAAKAALIGSKSGPGSSIEPDHSHANGILRDSDWSSIRSGWASYCGAGPEYPRT